MVKLKEIPFLLFVAYTLLYATIGNPDSFIWTGIHYIVLYSFMIVLLLNQSKRIKVIGISLCGSILLFVVLKFFLKLEIERGYSIVPFLISLIAIIIFDRRWIKSKKQ